MRGSRHAAIAASTIASGVGKSGSPAPKPMTSRPAALSALAFASTASVADSLIAAIRAETRGREAPGTHPSFRMAPRRSTRLGRIHRFDPLDGPDVHWRVRRACPGYAATGGGQWLNWQSSGLQNRRLGVRVPPALQETYLRRDLEVRTAGDADQ